ncbi:unnamed protein product [Echinostoma caproni]|uniref:Alpha-mannosidase n=1 Tax=Echinostoma caproni TaxID=27848 RepID=A0A183BC35_9TREM|nr:unnamed protein product [Echinostoma caproni]
MECSFTPDTQNELRVKLHLASERTERIWSLPDNAGEDVHVPFLPSSEKPHALGNRLDKATEQMSDTPLSRYHPLT